MHAAHIKANLEEWQRDQMFHTIAGACGDLIRDVERLRAVLLEVNHTLCIHGHIDQETPLHERVHVAIAETA